MSCFSKLYLGFLILALSMNATFAGGPMFNMAFFKLNKPSPWIKTLGGSVNDNIRSLTSDSAGNVYVVGDYAYSTGATDFNDNALPSTVGSDVFVAKLNSSGSLQWIKTMGGTGIDWSYAVSVDSGGNVYVGGVFTNTAANANAVKDFSGATLLGKGGGDAFIAKLDNNGNQQWIKILGGTQSDALYGAAADQSGNIYVIGYFLNPSTDGYGVKDFAGNPLVGITTATTFNYDVFVAKLDATGTQQWITKLGSSSNDMGNSIAVDSAGNVLVCGHYSTGAKDFSGATLSGNQFSAFIAKLNSSGIQQWINTLRGSQDEAAASVAVDSSDNVYVSGNFENDSANTNNVVDFSGATIVGSGATTTDAYVAKLNASGVQQWIKVMGGTQAEYANEIAVDSSFNVYVSGYYTNDSVNTNLVKDFAGVNLLGQGGSDVYLAKLNSTGSQQWIKSFGGSGADSGSGLAVSNTSVLLGGTYTNDNIDTKIVKDVWNNVLLGKTTTNTATDIFVLKYVP